MIYVLFILSCVLCNTLGKNVSEDCKDCHYSIKASGGGVVKPTEILNLTYTIGEENKNWSKCIWYKYQPGETDHTYCTFLSRNNSVQIDRCNDSISTRVKYVGTSKAECKIQINVTLDDDATWASRVFDESNIKDPPRKEINITVSTPITAIKSNVTKITTQAGNKIALNCSVASGAPIPEVKFTSDLVLNETSITRNTFTFVPKIEDNGHHINCTATQYNKTAGLSTVLSTKNISIPINVIFIPQPKQAQTINVGTDEGYNISLTFKANPTPTSIFWFINRKGLDDTKNAPNLIKNLTKSNTDQAQYTIQLNFPKSEKKQGTNQDNLGDYYLLIKNDLGQTKYYFNVKMSEGGSSGWVKAVVIILVIAIIIGILVCYKKYYQPKKRQDELRSHLDFNNPLSYQTA